MQSGGPKRAATQNRVKGPESLLIYDFDTGLVNQSELSGTVVDGKDTSYADRCTISLR